MPKRQRVRSTADLVSMDAFFAERPAARDTFDALCAFVATLGPTELVSTKSRVAFVAKTRFLWVHQANLDGSVQVGFLLRRRIDAERVRAGRVGSKWSNHVRLGALDEETRAWFAEAHAVDTAPTPESVRARSRRER